MESAAIGPQREDSAALNRHSKVRFEKLTINAVERQSP
jgi:hypothetical protein